MIQIPIQASNTTSQGSILLSNDFYVLTITSNFPSGFQHHSQNSSSSLLLFNLKGVQGLLSHSQLYDIAFAHASHESTWVPFSLKMNWASDFLQGVSDSPFWMKL